MVDKGPASLTDSERFSSDGSNTSKSGLSAKDRGTKKLRPPILPSSSRRRVGIATVGAMGGIGTTKSGTTTMSARKSSSFQVEVSARRASSCSSSSHVVKNGKSLDAPSSGRGERSHQQQHRRPPRKYIQESSPSESSKPRQQEDTASSSSGTPPPPKRPPRKYAQESNESSSSSSRQPRERRQFSMRTSTIDEEQPRPHHHRQQRQQNADDAHIHALLRENEALETERATIEKYKRMYEAILKDPEHAFLFDNSRTRERVFGGGVGKNNDEGEEKNSTDEKEDTFTAAVNVEELIRGLTIKDPLHESSAQMGSSTGSESREIRQGERTARASVPSLENIEKERVESNGRTGGKPGGLEAGGKSRSEDVTTAAGQGLKSRSASKRGGLDGSIKSCKGDEACEENAKSRSGSKRGGLESSIRSHQSDDAGSEHRVKSRSNSNRSGLKSSIRSRPSEDVRTEQRVKPRSNSKRGGLDSSIKSHQSDYAARSGEEPRRKSAQRRSTQDPNLNASATSEKSALSSSSRYDPSKDDRDTVSVSSNASRSSSRMEGLLNRFSFSSNADDDMAYEEMTDAEDDVVPDLRANSTLEKKEKKGLFRTMKKFGQKVSKVFVPSGPGGIKRYKVGEVARYNIGKIRDSFESFDPCDPTVEVTIIAVHIDAVLEMNYYTIQLPDGSRKQTNMENLIPLEDYNNGTRPYTRIKETRSSSRRRSSGRDNEDDDDDDDRSLQSSRSIQSNRSSSSRRSSRRSEESESPPHANTRDSRNRQSSRSSSRHRNDDRCRHESSSSRNKPSTRHQEDRERSSGSRRYESYRDEDDNNYRPKVDAMRGGGMTAPDRGANLRRSKALSKTRKEDKGRDEEEPVIIKLSSRNTVGGSFALDAAVAAAVGARRSAAVSVSSSRSCCADSYKMSAPESQVKKESQDTKPPVVVELLQKKSMPAKKSSMVVEFPQAMIKHAKSVDDATFRLSRCGSEPRRSHSTGPPREKPLPRGTCSKCDGCHRAVDCPIYLKDREKHKDAWRYYGDKNEKKQMGEDGGNKRVKANRIKQPADGSCLFHSLVYCLNSMRDGRMISSSTSVSSSSSTVSSCVPPPLTAKYLRRKIASFVAANPNLLIADDPLREWILWDSGKSVQDYAAEMAVGGWGGGVEIAACSHMYNVNIHVYEADPKSDEFVRISCFNLDSPKRRKTLHVLYHGRNHYDALQLK